MAKGLTNYKPVTFAQPQQGLESKIYGEPGSTADPVGTQRIESSNTRHRTGSTPDQRAGHDPNYIAGYGRPSPQNSSALSNPRSSLLSPAAWGGLFPTSQQPGLTPDAAAMLSPYSDPTDQLAGQRSPSEVAIMSNPLDWRGKTGVSNPPPMNSARAPLINPTHEVHMAPMPAPLTGPMGNAGTDAANLAQNQAMYAPGGMITHDPGVYTDPHTTADIGRQYASTPGTSGGSVSFVHDQRSMVDANGRPLPPAPAAPKTAIAPGITPAVDASKINPYV